MYENRSGFNYSILMEELWSNIYSVQSSVIADAGLNWRDQSCPGGKDGLLQYKFTVSKSKTRKFRNLTILPLG